MVNFLNIDNPFSKLYSLKSLQVSEQSCPDFKIEFTNNYFIFLNFLYIGNLV